MQQNPKTLWEEKAKIFNSIYMLFLHSKVHPLLQSKHSAVGTVKYDLHSLPSDTLRPHCSLFQSGNKGETSHP